MKKAPPAMGWTLYILKCKDGSLYTGITKDLMRRVEEHSSGKGARYTRGRGPFKVVYTEMCKDRTCASKREVEVKALSREEKLAICAHYEAP